jgi:hypothetical protein
MPKPVPVAKYRLEAKGAVVPTVIKVYELRAGVAWIAPVVVWTVTPFWTTGTASVPVRAEAVGKDVIVTLAIIDFPHFAIFYLPNIDE